MRSVTRFWVGESGGGIERIGYYAKARWWERRMKSQDLAAGVIAYAENPVRTEESAALQPTKGAPDFDSVRHEKIAQAWIENFGQSRDCEMMEVAADEDVGGARETNSLGDKSEFIAGTSDLLAEE